MTPNQQVNKKSGRNVKSLFPKYYFYGRKIQKDWGSKRNIR